MIIKGNSVGHPLPDPRKGLEMQGGINMNGQPISGLNAPTANDQAANMGFINQQVKKAAPRNLLDNSDFRNPVNQRGKSQYMGDGYTIDRWISDIGGIDISVEDGCVSLFSSGAYNLTQIVGDYKSLKGKTATFALRYGGDLTLVIGYYANGAMQYRNAESVNGLAIGTVVIPDNAESITFFIQTKASIKASLYWAALYEGEYTAETLPEYRAKGYMVEALNCGALTVHKTLTLSANGWSSSTPYTQTIAVEGILGTDTPHYSIVYSADTETALAQKEAFAMVDDLDTADGSVKFTCFEEKPEVDLTIQLEVNR